MLLMFCSYSVAGLILITRLRDLSQETEQEQRKRVTELEKDINGIEELRCKITVATNDALLIG